MTIEDALAEKAGQSSSSLEGGQSEMAARWTKSALDPTTLRRD
jgi:hypothetical protein